MTDLKGKKILLGITGSIAAYKSAYLIRTFIKKGAEVRVVMTPSASSFIGNITISTLSKHKVFTDLSDGDSWNNHVELGLWADCMLIAPITANTLAKMAHGICDNMLLAVYLSAKCPVYFAPAMDLDMWKHPSTKNNINTLTSFGNIMISPTYGELASGLEGEGRMEEPDEIVKKIEKSFSISQDFAKTNVLISAGPTYEYIDPVRFIGNHSTGKMGVALAKECEKRGAKVTLVIGPNHLDLNDVNADIISVKSALEMLEAMKKVHDSQDIVIFSAAVADYTPMQVANQKIKKTEGNLNIELKRTADIAANLGNNKSADQIHIGFALETQNETSNALRKLEKKNFDLIVLNSLNDRGAGFGHDTNKVTIFSKQNQSGSSFPLKSKSEVASDILDKIVEFRLNKKSN